jgi:hypothetical protein
VRFDRERPEHSVWIPPAPASATEAGVRPALRSLWSWVRTIAVVLALIFVAGVVGEMVPALKTLERAIARHEGLLLALTIALTFLGFALFMGGIVYRIFFGGDSTPMSHADVEDMGRRVRETGPAVARAGTYRFRGRTGGASFSDEFTVREAKQAWRRRAWRTSVRWRSNFVVMAGAFMLGLGLFGIFLVIGPLAIKLLLGAAVAYAAVRTIAAFARS